MSTQRDGGWSRREFLSKAALAGGEVFLGLRSELAAAEPPPETTRIRLIHRTDLICIAPQYLAEELLRAEGFTEVQYVQTTGASGAEKALASGEAHLSMHFTPLLILRLEAGDPIVIIGGGHAGCFELFANERVRAIRDLKGKAVALPSSGRTSIPGILLRIMLAQVGLDPYKDIKWVERDPSEHVRLLSEGKIDAFLAFPPTAQELHVKKIGHVIFNSMMDRPWSQYFCCIVAGNREFVRKHPATTKRVLRALGKAAEFCAREPERAARLLVDKGFMKNYDYALQTMKDMEMGYSKWRDYDPEDTVRFYSLRLQEVGMIKSTPQKIIAQGTDWRFLRELKKELKG
jgi:NitT/TauT family transport system substrate-binding protein